MLYLLCCAVLGTIPQIEISTSSAQSSTAKPGAVPGLAWPGLAVQWPCHAQSYFHCIFLAGLRSAWLSAQSRSLTGIFGIYVDGPQQSRTVLVINWGGDYFYRSIIWLKIEWINPQLSGNSTQSKVWLVCSQAGHNTGSSIGLILSEYLSEYWWRP